MSKSKSKHKYTVHDYIYIFNVKLLFQAQIQLIKHFIGSKSFNSI